MKVRKTIVIGCVMAMALISNAFSGSWVSTASNVYITNGRVGVGTTSPTELFSVNGTIGVKGQRVIDADPTNIYLGDLASSDGTRSLALKAGDAIRLFINVGGNVGIGTVNPQASLWAQSGDTGFPSFVAAKTSGSAPIAVFYKDLSPLEEVMRITRNGNVGIGEDNPSAALWVESGDTGLPSLVVAKSAGTAPVAVFYKDVSPASIAMTIERSGNVSVSGTLTTGSSRSIKERINELNDKEALDALNRLQPVSYYYKADKSQKNLGFVAEDVPELVARNDRKSLSPMDFAALSVKVIQVQEKKIDSQEKKISEQEKQNIGQEKRIEALEKKIAELSLR